MYMYQVCIQKRINQASSINLQRSRRVKWNKRFANEDIVNCNDECIPHAFPSDGSLRPCFLDGNRDSSSGGSRCSGQSGCTPSWPWFCALDGHGKWCVLHLIHNYYSTYIHTSSFRDSSISVRKKELGLPLVVVSQRFDIFNWKCSVIYENRDWNIPSILAI